MKKLIALMVVFAATNVFAESDYQSRAEAAFKGMTATQAWSSNFDKQIDNIGFPGTSTYVKATGVCVAGDSLQTLHKIPNACTTWSYRNNEGDKKTTTSAATASRNDGRCVAYGASRILTAPINFTVEVKVWGSREDGKVKVYRNRSEAKDAKGTLVLVDTKTVSRRLPTTFNVNFFRSVSGSKFDSDEFVGSHKYSLSSCSNND